MSPEYIAAYILDTSFDFEVTDDILKNAKKFNMVCNTIKARFMQILTPEGRNSIDITFDKGTWGDVIMVRIYKLDGRRKYALMNIELGKRQYKK